MNKDQIKRVYNRAYDEAFVTSGGGRHELIESGVLAVADWAREEALREAEKVLRGQAHHNGWIDSQDAQADIRALAEGSADVRA